MNAQKPSSQPPTPNPQHSLVWLLWLVAGVIAVSSNPLLNALVIAQATLVALTCHTDNPIGRSFGLFLRLGLMLLVVRSIFAIVPVGGVSYGATTLLRLPEISLPIWLGGLQVGGVATLEMLVQGMISGVRLWALILVFGAFNAVADHYALLRRTPRMLFNVGLATTIALTFVPQVVLHLEAIRDAQRVRGHRFRTWRDGLPLLVPLLSGGLERSIQLAESMDSRGYGRTTVVRRGSIGAQLLTIAGLTVLALGLYGGFSGSLIGWIGAIGGGAIAALALQWISGGSDRTRYLQERWHARDTLVALSCSVLTVGLIVLRSLRMGGLVYSALPQIGLPRFDPLVGVLFLLLSTPAVIQLLNTTRTEQTRERAGEQPNAHMRSRMANRS